jgi:hypothetical protein
MPWIDGILSEAIITTGKQAIHNIMSTIGAASVLIITRYMVVIVGVALI